MSRLTDESLADLLAKAEAATPGPWELERSAHGGVVSIRGMTPMREDWHDEDDEPTLPAVVWDPNVFHHTRGPQDREFIAAANPATVSALVREVQALRKDRDCLRQQLLNARAPEAIITENNALRRNNERLRRRLSDADCTEQVLRQELHDARNAATTAQMMAAHWKIQATGKPLDED